MSLTAITVAASAGLLSNQGLGVNPNLVATFSNVSTSGLYANIRNIITANIGDQADLATIANLGNVTCGFLTNQVPAELVTSLQTNVAPILGKTTTATIANIAVSPYTSLLGNVGNAHMSGGYSAFLTRFSQCQSSAYMACQFLGVSTTTGNTAIGDLGAGYKSVSDVASNGIGTAGVDLDGIKGFGSVFDWNNYKLIGNPGYLVNNLISLSLGATGGLQDKLTALGIDATNAPTTNPNVINSVLKQITGTDLQKIISTVGYTPLPGAMIASLLDVMDITKMLKADVLKKYNLTDMQSLGDLLGTYGGRFATPADTIAFLKTIQTIPLTNSGVAGSGNSAVSANATVVSSASNSLIAKQVGAGSGPFGNPIIPDYFGAISGDGHLNNLANVAIINSKILNTTLGQQIVALLKKIETNIATYVPGVSGPPPVPGAYATPIASDLTSLQTKISQIATDSTTKDMYTQANTAWLASINHLINEQDLMKKAGVDFTYPIPSNTTLALAFAQQLHGLGLDVGKLGTYKFINDICQSDEYGDKIRAALVEGRNIDKLNSIKDSTSQNIQNPVAQLGKAPNL
jgi:hypothetical protein